jgi:hypothetical protein
VKSCRARWPRFYRATQMPSLQMAFTAQRSYTFGVTERPVRDVCLFPFTYTARMTEVRYPGPIRVSIHRYTGEDVCTRPFLQKIAFEKQKYIYVLLNHCCVCDESGLRKRWTKPATRTASAGLHRPPSCFISHQHPFLSFVLAAFLSQDGKGHVQICWGKGEKEN